MYEVQMPKLSDSMEEGKIIQWKVKEGDEVHQGDVLAEVESDKAVMELECFRDGVVASITHGDDEEVPVGEVIALIREKDEAAAPAGEAKQGPGVEVAKPTTEEKFEEPQKPAAPRAPSPQTKPVSATRPPGKRVAISPYARKLAEQRGIDYTKVTGTGPGGRIVARDIESAAAGRPAVEGSPPGAPVEAERPVAKEKPAPPERAARAAPPDELPPLDMTEDEADVVPAPFRLKTQARRVTAAKHLIPHFYITCGVEVSRLVERQQQLKETVGATLTHLVMLACLKTLEQHPEVNRSYDHDRVIKWKGVNLGLAVDTEQGLTVAVLRQAQDLALEEIVKRTGPLVERARTGKLSADERRHATFTITNLGMLGVDQFAPIINPPSAITLAVASARPATVVKDDAIRIGKVMNLTAACDHRIVDGATAARFMKDLADLLQDPAVLLGNT